MDGHFECDPDSLLYLAVGYWGINEQACRSAFSLKLGSI